MKVMVLGIDGLDSEMLSKFEDNLPNFKKLKEDSPNVKLSSVFPPDSPTAWASIYTGKNPAEHGIVLFKDSFDSQHNIDEILDDIPGTTFWDVAGKLGKKVCIILPRMAYPPWPVNGAMISRTTESEDIKDIKNFDIKSYPPEFFDEYDFEGLKPPSSPLKLGDIIEPTKELILNEIRLASKICKEINWDLYFYYSHSLDKIQHLFWMHHDKNDPYYKEDNPYEDVVFEFHKFYDKHVIGKFLKLIDSKTAFIVLSDHGHGMRPTKVININEILKKKGLLKSKIEKNNRISKDYLMNLLRKKIIKTMNSHRLAEKFVLELVKIFPQGKKIYVKSIPIDENSTLACLSDLARGTKEYSYAGIRINNSLVNESSYKVVIDEIIEILQSIKDPFTSKNVIEWIHKREEIYNGKYIEKYPDIIFKLKDDWGAGWDINAPVFAKSETHTIQPGSHRAETAVFLIKNHGNMNIKKNMTLMDIPKTILQLLTQGRIS
ncbi:alkaline phosphatase family protein [Candidatus Bipolaricaulota bacterium]|nr:alkaline phosphatase family protein [Candidatus Bipolaricaulota bacterium]